MNVVKITNKIALATVILLVYWVFIFICSSVFGFKVFRENMTEVFLLSILGILAILSGAIILNVMFNLTVIAGGRNVGTDRDHKNSKKSVVLFLGSLVAIFILLYVGDLATAKKKESYLIASAANLLEEQKKILDRVSDYSFSRDYIERVRQDIKVLSKVEEKFPRVTVIVRDSFLDKPLLLGFTSYTRLATDEQLLKADYILSTSSEERQYLNSIFDGESREHRFSSNNGRYEIYYPVKTENGLVVIHLSQFSRYGKIGS